MDKTRTITKVPDSIWYVFSANAKAKGLKQNEYFKQLMEKEYIEMVRNCGLESVQEE